MRYNEEKNGVYLLSEGHEQKFCNQTRHYLDDQRYEDYIGVQFSFGIARHEEHRQADSQSLRKEIGQRNRYDGKENARARYDDAAEELDMDRTELAGQDVQRSADKERSECEKNYLKRMIFHSYFLIFSLARRNIIASTSPRAAAFW